MIYADKFSEIADTRHGNSFDNQMNRSNFVRLAQNGSDQLEIGPLHNPQLIGSGVKYFDLIDTKALKQKAIENGLSPSKVPKIDYFHENGDLSIVPIKFDSVFSSHVIEHQPNLIKHLNEVSFLLKDKNSSYFVIIPDHRYCFDHYISPSNLSEIISAFELKLQKPPKHKVIEHWAMTTHNDPHRHWHGDHGQKFEAIRTRWEKASKDYDDTQYIDAHCWQFTPSSFKGICDALYELGFIDMQVANIWETNYGDIEFFAELRFFDD
jgi:hypothetical protein